MKTIQITRRFVRHEWGGTETVVLETSKRMLSRGHTTKVLCPNALADRDRDEMDGVRIQRFPYFYPYLGLSASSKRQLDQKAGNLFSFSLLRYLKSQPDIQLLHAHSGKRLGGIVRHVALQRNIPYVVSLHGGCLDVPVEEASSWTKPTRGTLEWGKVLGWWVGSRRVLNDAAAIICVGRRESKAIQDQFPNQRVVELPNGVDTARFTSGNGRQFRKAYDIAPSDFLILCVGRIDPQKNQLALIRAMPELLKTHRNLKLMLIGHVTNSDYLAQIQHNIVSLGLHKQVKVIPGIDNQSPELVDGFHAADLCALPSLHEPFGIVVVESWAARTPIVASRVGGLMDLISDGVDGILFDPSNPNDLLNKLRDSIQMPADHRQMMIEAAFRKASQQYSWERVTDQLVNLYDEVVV